MLFTARRPHLVVLDIGAQIIWIAVTVGVFALVGIGFAAQLPLSEDALRALDSGVPLLVAATLLQTVLSRAHVLTTALVVAGVVCCLGWVVWEAFVRAGLLPPSSRSFLEDARSHFGRYLWTGVLRRTVLGLGIMLMILLSAGPLLTAPIGEWDRIWPDVQWAALAGLAIVALSGFCLMTLETLLRSDAIDALGRDLSRVVGIVAALTIVEVACVLVATATSLLVVRMTGSVGNSIGVVIFLIGVLAVNHSYMTLVRYAAIGIVRSESGYGDLGEHAIDWR